MKALTASVAAAAAIAVSIWVGWTRYALLEPAPIAVLTASAPATVHGAVFTLVGLTTLPVTAEAEDGEDAVPGSMTVRLDLLQTGGGEDLACEGWLVAGPDRWRNRYSPDSSCTEGSGRQRRLSFAWQVPAGTRPTEFWVGFGSERMAIRP